MGWRAEHCPVATEQRRGTCSCSYRHPSSLRAGGLEARVEIPRTPRRWVTFPMCTSKSCGSVCAAEMAIDMVRPLPSSRARAGVKSPNSRMADSTAPETDEPPWTVTGTRTWDWENRHHSRWGRQWPPRPSWVAVLSPVVKHHLHAGLRASAPSARWPCSQDPSGPLVPSLWNSPSGGRGLVSRWPLDHT